jgi:uncharacterized repeat protein (TIGR01451 family)
MNLWTTLRYAIARSRKCWYALISGLTLLMTIVGYYPSALTQTGTPFICNRSLYITEGQPTTQLSLINTTTANLQLSPIGTANVEYNAVGFNIQDGFVYGMAPQSVGAAPPITYRIDANGVATPLGPPTGFPVIPAGNPNNSFAFAGDVDANGFYFVYITNVDAPQPNLFRIDVLGRNGPPNTVVSAVRLDNTTFADIAINPVDGQIYAYNNPDPNNPNSNQIAIVEIDQATGNPTGNITFLPTTTAGVTIDVIGASFFDSFGNFFAYDSEGQLLVTPDLANPNNPNRGIFTSLSLGGIEAVNRFDGASCAFAPIMEKVVEPSPVLAGQTVTYTYRIANATPSPFPGVTFTDTMDSGRTFVANTLNLTNITGGTPNNFGGTSTLTITGLTIPARTIALISVQVKVPPTIPPGTVLTNQATISGFPPGFGGPTISSDFPPTGGFPDPTPLPVLANPSIGAAKTLVSLVNQQNGNFQSTYNIVVQNLGNVDLSNVQLTENLTNTFGTIPFTVNSVTSPSGNLTPNPNFNGATVTELLAGTDTLGLGESKTIQLVVTFTPGSNPGPFNNQVEATGQSPSGTTIRDTSTNGVNPDPDGDGNPTNNNDPTPTISVPPTGEPRLRLVKRITNITRGGVPVSGITFNSVVDNPNDSNDNAPAWSQLPGGLLGILGLGPETPLQSGDEVDYSVYFLSDGSQQVTNAQVCDPIPEGSTFIPNSFGAGTGILLNQGGTQTPQTNALDTDKGTFSSPLTPVTAPCPNTNNPTGAVVLQLGDVPNTAPNNVGFVRFRIKID